MQKTSNKSPRQNHLELTLYLASPTPLVSPHSLHAVGHLQLNTHSVALVRERTILTERPPPVGEVSANFCG